MARRATPGGGVEARFVSLASPTARRAGAGGHPCQGLYWARTGSRPRLAVIAAHYNVDFAEHYLAPCFAERGIGFLGWNTRFRGAEDLFVLDHALIDIGAGVRWLREEAGARTIVLLGNSGGGSLMAAYQAQATGAVAAADLRPAVREALEGLIPGDLYISLNAHRGRPEVLTAWMDASVIDEADPVATDPSLDIFNPAHGPPFTADFIDRYRTAQRRRNQAITDWAKAELARLNAARIADRVFAVFRTWADPRFIDPAIDASARPCPGCYAGDPALANRGPFGIGRASTLKTWLAMWSLETSPCQGGPQLARLAVPALVVQSLADMGVFPSDARAIFAAVAAPDKSLELIPGAHYFEDSEIHRRAAADLMAGWIAARA
jgi:pimeloyl-ACP methyl ester carboxylesterase